MWNLKILLLTFICYFTSACSSTTTNEALTGRIQKVELGTITQVKKIPVTKNTEASLGSSVGVTVGSGGHTGIYGAFDISKIISALNKPTHQLELMIKKQNGTFVVITQPLGGHFKVGDKVKILLRNGLAVVQH